MRRALALVGLIYALATPAFAEGESDRQIFGLMLGQSAPDPSDFNDLPAFGPIIMKSLKGLALVDRPVPHYLLDLGNDRMLGVWFDGASKDRPIFWLDLTVPEREESGLPSGADVTIKPRFGAPIEAAITIDSSLPAARRAEIKHAIDAYIDQHPITEIPVNDPRFRLTLLGEYFRGQMLSLHRGESGPPVIETELFDGALAQQAE
jgi:hypothetical protein